jgi:hypothetical protein
MSSRSLAAARARRSGDQAPPVSGNRPVTSIGSQAAFSQQPPQQSSNVRTARAFQQQQPQQQYNKQPPQQYQQFYEQPSQQQQPTQNGLPFHKLSISDAIGLITLRLGRVEQWIIDTDHENETKANNSSEGFSIPDNHKIIDNSVLASIINRLDGLEKGTNGSSSEQFDKVSQEVKALSEQLKRIGDDVTKHNLEMAKCSEQVFRFNRELTETKDILKSFMVKYDMFAEQTTNNFSDYEQALSDLEKRLPTENGDNQDSEMVADNIGTNINDIDSESNVIMSVDLKNIIKQELSNS